MCDSKEFYSKLDIDKIKINWNKKPIKMDLFLSFLTVDVKRSDNHLGSSTGWTQLTGKDSLIIGGGVIKGIEYLDRIKYQKNMDNPYNNYVNPFYLFNILTDEGVMFFRDYYAEDIRGILKQAKLSEEYAIANKERLFEFWEVHCDADSQPNNKQESESHKII